MVPNVYAFGATTYSASADERVTSSCLRELHEMVPRSNFNKECAVRDGRSMLLGPVGIHIANQVMLLASIRAREIIRSRKVAEDEFDRNVMRLPGVVEELRKGGDGEHYVGAGGYG